MNKEALYELQELVLARLRAMAGGQMSKFKLCGGTALARCWLDHRVSYDLDLFLPHGFNAFALSKELKSAGFSYETTSIVEDSRKANQLHGYVIQNGRRLKVSFIEDAYFDLFPVIQKPFGRLSVETEDIAGLYHRKLRTVSGSGMEGDSFEGGRQKARDLFDLYVLSKSHSPIREFMDSLPYQYPSDAFDNGIVSMPWHELTDELSEIICAQEWAAAKDIGFLQNALFEQIGATTVEDDAAYEENEHEENQDAYLDGIVPHRKKPRNGGMAP